MKKFKVLVKNWHIYPDESKSDVLIESDEEALEILGGYLCFGMDGKLKIIEGDFISVFTHEHKVIVL